jgi:hypothetical protein
VRAQLLVTTYASLKKALLEDSRRFTDSEECAVKLTIESTGGTKRTST